MATTYTTHIIDDIDGVELTADNHEHITIMSDGQEYELDLSKENARQLWESLEPYMSAARSVRQHMAKSRTREASYVHSHMSPTTRSQNPSLLPSCGTSRGYHAHLRRNESACSSCKHGWAEYQRNQRLTRKK